MPYFELTQWHLIYKDFLTLSRAHVPMGHTYFRGETILSINTTLDVEGTLIIL